MSPIFNTDNKFDVQLEQGRISERLLAKILCSEKIEVKSESYLWRRTGNICIEFSQNGRPSGIAVTQAKYWAHILYDDNRENIITILIFPVERLKQLCARARKHENGGDGGRFGNYLLKICDVIK